MPFIKLSSETTSSPHDDIMLGLYKGLWEKGEIGIVLKGRRKVPRLPEVDKQIILGIQYNEEHTVVDADTEVNGEQSEFFFRHIQLPDGLRSPITAEQFQPHTKLLIRSCYDRILEKIGKRSCAAVLGGPGIGDPFGTPLLDSF